MKLVSFCCCSQAVAFVKCEGISLKGRVAEMRGQLVTHLPEGDEVAEGTDVDDEDDEDDDTPEYPTQDTWDDKQSSDEEDEPPRASVLRRSEE